MMTTTRILAFTRSWSPDRESAPRLAAIGDHLEHLDAELIILCDTGVWTLDGAEIDHTDRLAGDAATAALLYAARREGDAVYVVDGASSVRVAHTATDLLAAIDDAAEVIAVRRVMTATAPVANANLSHRRGAELFAAGGVQ